jgi:hypothetical protein
MDDEEEFDDSPIELNAKCRHVTAVVGRLGIGTDGSLWKLLGCCGPRAAALWAGTGHIVGLALCFLIRPRAFLSLSLSAVRFDRSFASASAREGIMAAVSSVFVLPLAPLRPLPLRRAVRDVLEGGGRRASSPLFLARYGLRRGRPAAASAAAVAGEAELPLEEAEAAMRVAADDDSITATVVSVLLTVAFVGLSLLTLGVRVCCDSRAVVALDGRCWSRQAVFFGWLTILFAMQVIYLSVQDFLQKREKEKFEKEEAERQKEEARKKRAKSRQKRRNY